MAVQIMSMRGANGRLQAASPSTVCAIGWWQAPRNSPELSKNPSAMAQLQWGFQGVMARRPLALSQPELDWTGDRAKNLSNAR
jgi:hypothetical protein